MITRSELVDVGARALATFWAASEKQPTDTDRAAASAALNAVLPLITEAVAEVLESVRASHQNCPHPECAQAYRDAARIAREWKP